MSTRASPDKAGKQAAAAATRRRQQHIATTTTPAFKILSPNSTKINKRPTTVVNTALYGGEIISTSLTSKMTLEECAKLLEKNNINVVRRTQMMPLSIGGHRATTGSKKAQRRCNDIMIGSNTERIKIVWSIDSTTLPPMSWSEHLAIGVVLVIVLIYAISRFIGEWNQWLRPPLTNKSKSYTPLAMLKPSRISMVQIVASEDQGVLVTKPTRKMVEVARLRSLRAQQLRAHYSEPTRLGGHDSSIAAALLSSSASRPGSLHGGPPAHAKTIAYSLAKFATAPSYSAETSPTNYFYPNSPPLLNITPPAFKQEKHNPLHAMFSSGTTSGGGITFDANKANKQDSNKDKIASTSFATGLSTKTTAATQHAGASDWTNIAIRPDPPTTLQQQTEAFFNTGNVTVTVTAASPPGSKGHQFPGLPVAQGGNVSSSSSSSSSWQQRTTKKDLI